MYMVDRIIDLRKKAIPAEGEKKKPLVPEVFREEVKLAWRAPEYEPKERSRAWFVFWGGVALLLVIFGVFAKSYFFMVFVMLAFLVLVAYEKKTPTEVSFSISGDGVSVGSTLYRFSDLKSFWVFEHEAIKELSLETKKTLSPYVRLPLKNMDHERIKNFLKKFLSEEEHQEFVTDKIARNL